MSDPMKSEIDEKKGKPLGSIEVGKEKFDIIERPDALLLSELARTGTEDPEAFGVIAEFFEHTLGKPTYARFKKAVRAEKYDEEALMGKLSEVLEQTMGRPTE